MIPINTQAPEKREHHTSGLIRVNSIFYTIQGEGPYAGEPAVFVRLAGCNLQCPGCDTEYSSGAYEAPESIVTRVGAVAANGRLVPLERMLVVITGGEPFRQDIAKLIDLLTYEAKYRVQVETNGTMPFDNYIEGLIFDIVCSPKAGKVHRSLWSRIIAYKYVLDSGNIDPRDGLPTSVLGMPAAPARPHEGFTGKIYVQAADEPGTEDSWIDGKNIKNQMNQRRTIDSAMRFGYTYCHQIHKVIGVE